MHVCINPKHGKDAGNLLFLQYREYKYDIFDKILTFLVFHNSPVQ